MITNTRFLHHWLSAYGLLDRDSILTKIEVWHLGRLSLRRAAQTLDYWLPFVRACHMGKKASFLSHPPSVLNLFINLLVFRNLWKSFFFAEGCYPHALLLWPWFGPPIRVTVHKISKWPKEIGFHTIPVRIIVVWLASDILSFRRYTFTEIHYVHFSLNEY